MVNRSVSCTDLERWMRVVTEGWGEASQPGLLKWRTALVDRTAVTQAVSAGK